MVSKGIHHSFLNDQRELLSPKQPFKTRIDTLSWPPSVSNTSCCLKHFSTSRIAQAFQRLFAKILPLGKSLLETCWYWALLLENFITVSRHRLLFSSALNSSFLLATSFNWKVSLFLGFELRSSSDQELISFLPSEQPVYYYYFFFTWPEPLNNHACIQVLVLFQ